MSWPSRENQSKYIYPSSLKFSYFFYQAAFGAGLLILVCFSILVHGAAPTTSPATSCRTSYYFVARRSSDLRCSSNATVTYDKLDESGKSMNILTGVFTAPESGVYVFNFNGLRNTLASKPEDYATRLLFKVNGNLHIASYAESNSPVGFTSILALQPGDQVAVSCNLGVLYSKPVETFTIFSGYMLPKFCL